MILTGGPEVAGGKESKDTQLVKRVKSSAKNRARMFQQRQFKAEQIPIKSATSSRSKGSNGNAGKAERHPVVTTEKRANERQRMM